MSGRSRFLAAGKTARGMACAGLLLLGSSLATCGQAPLSAGETHAVPGAELDAAIHRAARYLASLCGEDGRFRYQGHLDPQVVYPPTYNELRHAGAIYALAQYCEQLPDGEAREAALQAAKRAAGFLRERCIGPVNNNRNLQAVWSSAEIVGEPIPRQAKLGGTGLALIALLSVERIEPGFTPLEQLRGLGQFLVFMQKSDGDFYSKFFPDTGRNDAWQSMYYPGEAALGLLMLHAADPSPQWMRAATRALDYLAHSTPRDVATQPDHWYLLATCKLLSDAGNEVPPPQRDLLLHHARRVCRDMMSDQSRQVDDPMISGCFTPDGRSCPSATRLEGLQAALIFLPANEPDLRVSIEYSVHQGTRFLLRCQVTEGPHAGAFPHVMQGYRPQSPATAEAADPGEIRVDYVQHALSAMLHYRAAMTDSPNAAPSRAAH